jgi:peptide-methionine (R)-S-oxide reductase
VLRQASTERRNSSPLTSEHRTGTFICGGCGSPLFTSESKYESGTGWPSFYDVIPGAVDLTLDESVLFMPRTEVRCHTCQGHLGHVFPDGPKPTGMRYCMNGAAMGFKPEEA